MDRCQTILPPEPPALTTLRASLGAFWFRTSTALGKALRRASQPSPQARPAAPWNEPGTPVLTAPIGNAGTDPSSAPQVTPEDDSWLRPTQVLPPPG